MDLKQIRYFVEVVEQGSISMAARKLGLTQPPVSKQMQLLERELGCALFLRSSQPLELTAEGKLLYERGVNLLAMAAGRPEFASLRLAGCRSFSEIPLPPDLKEALGVDWAASLAEIEAAPQQTACRTLAYLVAECRKAEQEAARNAAQVRRLCLPLGGSLGLMAAILLV